MNDRYEVDQDAIVKLTVGRLIETGRIPRAVYGAKWAVMMDGETVESVSMILIPMSGELGRNPDA